MDRNFLNWNCRGVNLVTRVIFVGFTVAIVNIFLFFFLSIEEKRYWPLLYEGLGNNFPLKMTRVIQIFFCC